MGADRDFLTALHAVYLENPCQTLPNALWQTLPRLSSFETAVGRSGQQVNRLEAWDAASIYIYWRRDTRQPSLLIRRRLETVNLALMHQDFLDSDIVAGFLGTRQPYFRLLHDHANIAPAELPEGFYFENVRLDMEQERAAAMIAHAEVEHKPAQGSLTSWMQPSVIEPDLWFWVKDRQIGMPVGVAIGVFDRDVNEVVLEWVQVIPAYQRRGLGRALVNELLRRAAERAQFSTVTGAFPFTERENPGGFFRGSGFTGQDVWWLLSR